LDLSIQGYCCLCFVIIVAVVVAAAAAAHYIERLLSHVSNG